MKLSNILFLFLISTYFCVYGGGNWSSCSKKKVDPWAEYKEFTYEASYAHLVDLQEFIKDYKTWPKEDQEKITLTQMGFMIEGNLNSSAEYDSNVGEWVSKRVTHENMGHFVNVIFKIQNSQS